MLIKIAAWCWHIIRTIMDWCRRVFTKITKVEIKDDVWNGFVQFVKFGLVGLQIPSFRMQPIMFLFLSTLINMWQV